MSNLVTDYATVARNVDGGEHDEHDFIIVGGGTAGCVLAARLSERPDIRVLVIEAGQSGRTLFESRAPAGFAELFRGPHDYSFYTVPQQHAANKKKFWPRARLLGGCMAHYGAPSDYDEFASIVGDDSWSWKNFETYFRKFENYTPDPRFPHVDASLRGSHGPVTVGYHAHIWEASPLFIEASINAGVPFNPDFTTSNGTLGTNKIMTYIDGRHERVSAEAAYLTPDVLARPNLKVVTLARVTRIIFDSSSGTPRAVAVEFANEKQHAPRFRVCHPSMLHSGGAVHTPQILMLSGVGPASILNKHNIPVLVDSPGVGANLLDHPMFALRLKDKLGISFNFTKPYDLTSTFKFVKALTQYKIFGTGPFSSNIGEAVAFFRTDDQKLFPPAEFNNDIEDSTSGPNAPDIELIIVPAAVDDSNLSLETGLHAYSVVTTILRPTSVGSIQLDSADPWDHPIIDPNYLATQHDLDVMIRGVRGAYKIAHTAPLTNVTDVGSTHPLLDHHFDRLSDKELGEIIRNRVETLYHPFGTCTMGKAEDPAAVLDTQLRVRGALGLRVCDASVYPKLVSGHTTAPVLAAAEKLADIIKAEYPATV
ncbi:alcohol oxidase [Imleria badia]|nr:alcohol oxidase [Imleria badia]